MPLDFSRPDPCSVDFGRETPKLCFEFAVDFVDFFLVFLQGKRPNPKSTKKNMPRKIIEFAGKFVRKIPLGFLLNQFLDDFWVFVVFGVLKTAVIRSPSLRNELARKGRF